MKVGKFTLSGATAFFKKPDVNTYVYYTYGHIHKIAVLGIFGSLLGYRGYRDWETEEEFPEFYQKLKDSKISIVPNVAKGYFPRKIQSFNNSVGYASKEPGGNLIVKEQWLEKPSWDIYFLIDSEETERLWKFLEERRCIYIPYLGSNDHFANITNAKLLDGEQKENAGRIDSLFPKAGFHIAFPDEEDEDEDEDVEYFKYEENLPVKLNKESYLYEFMTFQYSNLETKKIDGLIYKIGEKHLSFY